MKSPAVLGEETAGLDRCADARRVEPVQGVPRCPSYQHLGSAQAEKEDVVEISEITGAEETIARSLCINPPETNITGTAKPVWSVYLPEARAICAALSAADLVIVPKEATGAMIYAWGNRTNTEGDCPCERKVAREWTPEKYSEEWTKVNAAEDWRAMLAASEAGE